MNVIKMPPLLIPGYLLLLSKLLWHNIRRSTPPPFWRLLGDATCSLVLVMKGLKFERQILKLKQPSHSKSAEEQTEHT